MQTLGVLEVKTRLSALLEGLERDGEPVIITRHGRPIARIVPEPPAQPKKRKYTGAQLAAMSKAFRDRQPPDPGATWEMLKGEDDDAGY